MPMALLSTAARCVAEVPPARARVPVTVRSPAKVSFVVLALAVGAVSVRFPTVTLPFMRSPALADVALILPPNEELLALTPKFAPVLLITMVAVFAVNVVFGAPSELTV